MCPTLSDVEPSSQHNADRPQPSHTFNVPLRARQHPHRSRDSSVGSVTSLRAPHPKNSASFLGKRKGNYLLTEPPTPPLGY